MLRSDIQVYKDNALYLGYDPVVLEYGVKYGTGLGFSFEEMTIFYLFVDQSKSFADIGIFLGQYREVIRKKFSKIYRKLVKCYRNQNPQ